MAPGQPRRGGSCRGSSHGDFPGRSGEVLEPPNPTRCPKIEAAQPRWHSRCQPRAPSPNVPTELWDGARSGAAASPWTEGTLVPSWHRGVARGGTGWVPSLARDPGRRRPPRLREAFQASRWGRERRQEEEESRKGYFLTLHILQVEHFVHFSPACKSISASAPGLDGGACESTAAGDDVAAGGGTGGRRGPPHTGAVWGVPLTRQPAAPARAQYLLQRRARCHHRIDPTGVAQGGGHTHTPTLLLPSCLTLLDIKYPG